MLFLLQLFRFRRRLLPVGDSLPSFLASRLGAFVAFALVLVASVESSPALAESRAEDSDRIAAQDAPSRGTSNVSPEVAQKAAAIARQTMSPFCPGRTLSDCPSEYATQWRKDIRAMVAAGMSPAEIQKELESRVGENLSGSPNREASYGVSIGLAIGAALVLFFVLSRLLGRRAPGTNIKESDQAKEAETLTSTIDDERLKQELEMAEGDDDR